MTLILDRASSRSVQSMVTLFFTRVIKSAAMSFSLSSPIDCTALSIFWRGRRRAEPRGSERDRQRKAMGVPVTGGSRGRPTETMCSMGRSPTERRQRGSQPHERRIRQGIAQAAGEAVGHPARLLIHLAAESIPAAVRFISWPRSVVKNSFTTESPRSGLPRTPKLKSSVLCGRLWLKEVATPKATSTHAQNNAFKVSPGFRFQPRSIP